MKPSNFIEETRSDRAVSPVIGVILMVAITVILAAVIGAFVLEIGDQQETAPSTSFDSEQATEFYDGATGSFGGSGTLNYAGNWDGTANLTTVYISHAGGDVLDVTQTEIVTEGNDSAMGVIGDDTLEASSDSTDEAAPQPDFRPALGSNDAVEFSSGDEWNVIGDARHVQPRGTDPGLHNDPWNNALGFVYDSGPDKDVACQVVLATDFYMNSGSDKNCNGGSYHAAMENLQTGDNVNVVWTASSGGKTQTLFKYTVQ